MMSVLFPRVFYWDASPCNHGFPPSSMCTYSDKGPIHGAEFTDLSSCPSSSSLSSHGAVTLMVQMFQLAELSAGRLQHSCYSHTGWWMTFVGHGPINTGADVSGTRRVDAQLWLVHTIKVGRSQKSVSNVIRPINVYLTLIQKHAAG